MSRIIVDDGTQRGNVIDIERIEIVTDDSDTQHVEIYLLDELGERVEGGSFDAEAFMAVVRQFYDSNF